MCATFFECVQLPYAPIAALASAGFLETAYLTATKLLGGQVACPLSGGCASVLTSDYATLLGMVPLSAAGMVAYGGVAALALAGLSQNKAKNSQPQGMELASSPLRSAVFAGSLLLSTTSAYLMYILFTQFPGEVCPWCLGSAGISAAVLALTASAMRKNEMEDAMMPGTGLVSLTILLLSLGLGSPDASQAGSGITQLEYRNPIITNDSSDRAVTLARKLEDAGAKMYGAFWCSHCYEQKQTFGKEAMADFPYIECFPEGWKQGVEMAGVCKEAGLEGFPTWVIGGEKLEGDQTLDQLEEALARVGAERIVAVE